MLAAGVLDTLRAYGLRPGPDISVTGFDDAPLAAPAGLTTVGRPMRDKGRLQGACRATARTFTEEPQYPASRR